MDTVWRSVPKEQEEDLAKTKNFNLFFICPCYRTVLYSYRSNGQRSNYGYSW